MTEEKREKLKKQLCILNREQAKNIFEGEEKEIEENERLQNLIKQVLKEDDPVRYEKEKINDMSFYFFMQGICETH